MQRLSAGLVTAVHESTHFLDLDFAHNQFMERPEPAGVSFFLIDQSRMASPALDLSSPYEVLAPLLNATEDQSKRKALLTFGECPMKIQKSKANKDQPDASAPWIDFLVS